MKFHHLILGVLLGTPFFLYSPSVKAEFYKTHVVPTLERSQDRTSMWILGSGLVATLLSRPYDDEHRERWMGHQLMSETDANLGDFLGTGIPGVTIALAQLYLFDHDNGVSHLRGITYAALTTYALKYGFGRKRPGDSQSYQAFPSGHTSTTFATATSLTYAYGWKAGVLAYPLAAFTAASRWADDAHWLSDTVAGAFLGVFCARAAFYNPEKMETSYWMPLWERDSKGILWVSHF